jgi:hypothetical protein
MGNLDGFRARHSMAEGPPQFNAAICTDHTLRMSICRAFQQRRAPPRIAVGARLLPFEIGR